MEESVILHQLESRTPGQKTEAIDELIDIVQDSGKLHFNNKLSLFSSFKRILCDEDLVLRVKCTKLISEILAKLGSDLDSSMSFVLPNIINNLVASNLVLKRESIRLIRTFSEKTLDPSVLMRSIIWEGIESQQIALSREIITNIDKLLPELLAADDCCCFEVVEALCKRYNREDNKKLRKAIQDSFRSIAGIVGLAKMEEFVTQMPTTSLSSAKELLHCARQVEKPQLPSYKSPSRIEVDSAISVDMNLLWNLIPYTVIEKLHGTDVPEQLRAIAELQRTIKKIRNPAEHSSFLEEICQAIIKVIPVNNFRVFKASTGLVMTFVETFKDFISDFIHPLTRVLCFKIGDNKIAVRESTMKCLTCIMKATDPQDVLEVVFTSFQDRNARVREESVNVVIKALLLFPIQNLNPENIVQNLIILLNDPKHRVSTAALEALAVLSDNLPKNKSDLIYKAVERLYSTDSDIMTLVVNRLDAGKNTTTVNNPVTYNDTHFARTNTTLSRTSSYSLSLPTTSQERLAASESCPPTPLSIPRRYYSAGRNRLPWQPSTSKQNTIVQGSEEQFPSHKPSHHANSTSLNHIFIKGGGARTDGGSYAQMHLKKIEAENAVSSSSPKPNTLDTLKKYFPSVNGASDNKRSWLKQNDDALSHNHQTSHDTGYGVQSSSMYQNYRINSGESSGIGNTPSSSASHHPRQPHHSPSTLNDSGIFEDNSFVNSKRSTPRSEHGNTLDGRSRARKEIAAQQNDHKREDERLEQARKEKIRQEETNKEHKRRESLKKLNNHKSDSFHEEIKADYPIGNGYVELNLTKKKLKQAAEESRKPRPKLIKTRNRTESEVQSENVDIDIVGRGLTSTYIEDVVNKEVKKEVEKAAPSPEKKVLRAPSGVYGQRVQKASLSPDEFEGSLSDEEETGSDDDSYSGEDHREGLPAMSNLSAATRMRLQKKRENYVERQSVDILSQISPRQRKSDAAAARDTRSSSPQGSHFRGKPVSAPVEPRTLHNDDTPIKASMTKVRASSLRQRESQSEALDTSTGSATSSLLTDEKYGVPLSNPEAALAEAIKNLRMGGEEWNYKVQGLHVLRRLSKHHADVFQGDILTIIRLSCTEVQNLRSSVSRLAIQVIGDYFVNLKSIMDADIDRTCDTLLSKTAELNQFIRNDIIVTLGKMVNHATPMRVLSALIQNGASHKNSSVRAIAAGCIKDVVEKMTVQKCLASKDMASRLVSTIEKFCTDGNPDTRYYGKLVLYWCMDVPNFEALCQRCLSASAARTIKDMCDKVAAKGVGPIPTSSDRTSGRYRSQPVSRAQSNLSATYPSNSRDRKASQETMSSTLPVESASSSVNPSPRVPRRGGPRRDVRESSAASAPDRIPPSLYANLSSSNWNDRYNGIAELLELSIKQTSDVKNSIVKICDVFSPRLKDNNSKVNLYALQCLLRIIPHIGAALDSVLTPITEHLIPNLASQRANIVTLTNKILDGIHHHLDNSLLLTEYCRIARTQTNPRIKPIILDKLCDIVPTVYDHKPRLTEQSTIPLLIEHSEYLEGPHTSGPHNLAAYVGRLTALLYEAMGSRLLTEVGKVKPRAAATIREYVMSVT